MATYLNTYFRIDAGYVWGEGLDARRSKAFYDEISLAFIHAGWTVEPLTTYGVIYVIKGKTRLYVHPMDLSGPCEKSLIPEVESILAGGTTWSHRVTDSFEELLDLDGEELLQHYREKYPEADAAILAAFQKDPCDRTPKYISSTLMDLGKRFHIPTLREHIGRSSKDTDQVFLRERFNALVEDGRIGSDGKTAHTFSEKEILERKTEPVLF